MYNLYHFGIEPIGTKESVVKFFSVSSLDMSGLVDVTLKEHSASFLFGKKSILRL